MTKTAGKLISPAALAALLLAAAALALSACGTGTTGDAGGGDAASGTRLAVGQAAPDFTLPNANGGGEVSLSSYQGDKPVVVVFYRSFFCTFCVRQVNEFSAQYQKFQEQGIEVVAISSDNLGDFRRTIAAENYPFPILYTSLDEAVPRSYDRIGHVRDGGYQGGAELADPGVFLIDSEGKLVWSELGTNIGHFVRASEVLSQAEEAGL